MKTVNAYARSRVRAIIRALEKYHEFQETDSLHRIRVEIKKLKSTLLIVGHTDRAFDSHKAYLPLRNMFRKAGQIRQPSVMLELMLAHGIEVLPFELLGDPQKARDRFRADTPFFIGEVKKLGKSMRPRWKAVRRKHITSYVKELQRRIRRAFIPGMKGTLLHATRKRLKQVVYLSRLTKRVKPKEIRFYGALEAAIGNLHDKESLLELFASVPGRTISMQGVSLRRAVAAERRQIAKAAKQFYDK